MDAFYPFSLNFDGLCARFPFIFEGTAVSSLGGDSGNPAPVCLISSRAAGDMAFRGIHGPAREGFFRSRGIPPERVYSLIQVHSHDVFALGKPEKTALDKPEKAAPYKPENTSVAGLPDPLPPAHAALPASPPPAHAALPASLPAHAALPAPAAFSREGDGMVSFSPGIALAVTVADCLPVFLLDTENGYWSVLHSGWKGTGIVLKALEILKQAGSRPEALAAVLGPCIQSCCYRVDEGRAKQFEAEFGSASHERSFGSASHERSFGSAPPHERSFGSAPPHERPSGFPLGPVSRRDDSGWYIGLQAANARLLAAAGVRHIAYCTDCTFTDDRLGSFRREGAQAYTRMIAMAGCTG